jgi:hypothetical protein
MRWNEKYNTQSGAFFQVNEGGNDWHENNVTGTKKKYRVKSNIALSILHDSIFKFFLLLPALYLLTQYLAYKPLFSILLFLVFTLSFLIFFQMRLLFNYKKLTHNGSLCQNLRDKYRYYTGDYQAFLFTGSLSSALLVLTGFLLYLHFKYGEIDLSARYGDLLLMTFIFFTWVITIFFQFPVYTSELKHLKESIMKLRNGEIKINFQKTEKLRNLRAFGFIMTILAGMLCFWVLYNFQV